MTLSGRGQARLRRALRGLGGAWYAEGRERVSVPGAVIHDLAHWRDFGWPLHEAPGGRDMGERIGDHLWSMTHHDRLHAEYRACAITLLAAHEVVGDSTDVPPHGVAHEGTMRRKLTTAERAVVSEYQKRHGWAQMTFRGERRWSMLCVRCGERNVVEDLTVRPEGPICRMCALFATRTAPKAGPRSDRG